MSSDIKLVGGLQKGKQDLPVCLTMDSRVPGIVVDADLRSDESPREMEEGVDQITSSETISSLVTQLLHAAQKGRRVDDTPLPEGELGPLSAVPVGLDTDVDPPPPRGSG